MRLNELFESALPNWMGSEHCWYNPTTQHYVHVGTGDSDHSGSSYLLNPMPADQFEREYGVDTSDYDDEPITVDDVPELLPADNSREAGILLGYAQINCNPYVTTIPYVIARTKKDLIATMRFLTRRGVHPEDHPKFQAETVNYVDGKMEYKSFLYHHGRLIPKE